MNYFILSHAAQRGALCLRLERTREKNAAVKAKIAGPKDAV